VISVINSPFGKLGKLDTELRLIEVTDRVQTFSGDQLLDHEPRLELTYGLSEDSFLVDSPAGATGAAIYSPRT
jgi:hypothetical protein